METKQAREKRANDFSWPKNRAIYGAQKIIKCKRK